MARTNDDDTLDTFASFVAGFALQDTGADKATKIEWRKACRTLSRHQEACPSHLVFSSPNLMLVFTKHATALPELTAQVPVLEKVQVKSWEARLHRPASIVRPTEIGQVQSCVHGLSNVRLASLLLAAVTVAIAYGPTSSRLI